MYVCIILHNNNGELKLNVEMSTISNMINIYTLSHDSWYRHGNIYYSSTFDIHLLQHFWLFLQFRVRIPSSINL